MIDFINHAFERAAENLINLSKGDSYWSKYNAMTDRNRFLTPKGIEFNQKHDENPWNIVRSNRG